MSKHTYGLRRNSLSPYQYKASGQGVGGYVTVVTYAWVIEHIGGS